MKSIKSMAFLVAIAASLALSPTQDAKAGYPVYYAPAPAVAPAVVGYSARRGGLFGQRVVMRPLVAPVAAPYVVARPVVPAYYAAPLPIAIPAAVYPMPYSSFYPLYGY